MIHNYNNNEDGFSIKPLLRERGISFGFKLKADVTLHLLNTLNSRPSNVLFHTSTLFIHHIQPIQATPEPTKRPLNSGSILLEVVFDSYRSQTEMVWHFERKFAFDWTDDTIFDGLNYSATSVINRDNSAPPSLGEFVTRALEVLKNNESIKNTGTVLGENRWKLWDKLNVQDHFYSMEVWDDRYSDYVYAFDGVTPTLLRPVKDGAKYRIRFGKAVLLKW
ncbi:hypothetical protein DdX_14642 [Ditylenchus destructor]|uniref:Uncharacterized protein n=1 Tax=Ditylenchus destructor TaxID=166010 RepID=A0AAD4QVF2_9BILA|nr:hypothetical protein DdX_14642 [Ditylenchus destructor]